MNPIYLDYNGTTPIDPQIAESMAPFINEHFGNPSSSHYFGSEPRSALDKARGQVANMLGCQPHEVIFTSGGTESNNQAVRGVIDASNMREPHLITSSVEHPSIINVCRFLEMKGVSVTYLPVDKYGMINPYDVEDSIRSNTALISIMHANNEVGTIQPLEQICEIAKKHQIPVHTDSAQSVGKIPVNVTNLGVDLLSIAGHKLYAPKGVGALYVKEGVQFNDLLYGASQEMGRRPGTENVIFSVALGEACNLIESKITYYSEHMRILRDRLESKIMSQCQHVRINGHPELRLPNTSSLSFKQIEANEILDRLENVAVSAGAACHSDSVTVSSVIEAMNVPLEFAMGTIRFSTGRYSTKKEIDQAATEVSFVVRSLCERNLSRG